MRATILGISAFSIIVLAAGCEKSQGIARTAKLATYPTPACVGRAIENVAQIERFDEHHEPEEEETGTRRFQNVSYEGMGVNVELGVFEESDHTRLIQSHLYMNEKPAQRDIEIARTLMRAVEEKLEEYCGIPDLGDLVREKCAGVGCG